MNREMNLNKLSFWLCWTIICLGLGYAWASGAYLKRINAQEKLIQHYQELQIPEVHKSSGLWDANKTNNQLKKKNW